MRGSAGFALLVLLLAAACQPASAPAPAAPASSGRTAPAPAAPAGGGNPAPPAATQAPAPAAQPTTQAAPAGAPPVTTVRAGTLGQAADVPFYWAKERGYLAQEGLDVETINFNSAQQMIAPLGADQLDAGYGAVGPGLVNANQRGINIRVVGGYVSVPPGSRSVCVLVRKELADSGAVRTFADMRGHVYAEPVPGNINTALFEKELRAAGVRPDELQYTVVTYPDLPGAFANGAVDIGFSVEPFGTLMQERGLTECFKSAGDLEANYQIAALLYGAPFAEQRPEAARGFTVALMRAMQDYARAFFGDGRNKEEIVDLLIRATPVKDHALYDRMPAYWLDANLELNLDSVRRTLSWYTERGDMPADANLDRMVDRTFADYALGKVGPATGR